MKAIKWVGIVLGGVLALVVVCMTLVAVFFDPNDYKADIERLAQERTQRKLTLQGDLKLSVFPWLAVEVGPAQLGERPYFGDLPFVSIERARLSIRLLPLLRGDVEIGEVLLEKPSIRLITDERGRNNWADLAGQETKTSPQATHTTESTVRASVASLRVENGAVAIDNRKDKTRTVIHDFNFTTGNIASAKPFDLKMSMVVEQDQRPPTPVKLSAVIATDFDAQKHVLNDFQFDTRWYGATQHAEKSDGVPVSFRVQSLSLDMKQQTFAMEGMNLAFGDAKISGALTGKEIFDAPQASGQIEIAPLSPRDLMRQAGIDPPATRDAEVLKKLSLRAQVEATGKSVAMQNLELKLDDTTASGQLSVVDFDAAALRFDLNLDRIDFDRYLPPPEEGKGKDATAKESPPTPIPVDTLRALNARGDLRIGEAKFSGMKLAKLHVGVNARDGDVRFAPTDAAIYGGTYKGSMAINAAGKTPVLTVEAHANNVDFAPLFKDMFETQKISGHGQTNVKVSATGADTLAMQKTLAGNLDFNVTDGAFEGTDLWYEIKRARALLKQEAAPERAVPARTQFTSCKGTGVIQNGVLTNNDLDMAMQFLKIGGQGSVDIVKSTLDYKLNVQVLRMNDDPKAEELVDAQIPVKISGSLASPSVKADVNAMVKARVKQEVEKQKDKVREKLQDKLQDLLRR
jgi:AsmA protein